MMMRLKKNHAGKSSEKGYLEDSDDDIKVARFIFCDSNKVGYSNIFACAQQDSQIMRERINYRGT